MTFIDWPHGAKVCMTWANGGRYWMNIWAFRKTDFNYTDQEALASALVAGLRTSYKNFLAESTEWTEIKVIDMRTQMGPAYVGPLTGVVGLKVSDQTALSLAVVLTFQTALRGRAFRGRMYLAGFTEDDTYQGLWQPDIVEECEAQVNAWRLAAGVIGWEHVIASEAYNGAPRAHAELTTVTYASVRNDIPGHQRRRDHRP